MKIFITGGTGFIGKALVSQLAKHKHELLILIRSQESLDSYFGYTKNIHILYGDLSNIKIWQKKVARFRPDVAVHMAWEGLPDYGSAMSIKNLGLGLGLIQMLADIGCKKIIAVGSCWEYGEVQGQVEETMEVAQKNAFSAAKTALHWLGREIAREKKIQFIWTRIFFVFHV